MSDMVGHVNKAALRRAAVDFGLALGLFWLVAVAVTTQHSKAHAVTLPAIGQLQHVQTEGPSRLTLAWGPRANPPAQASSGQSLGLLSLAFAFLATLNLAIWRHLRRAYASPRRGVWRRD
jgi:hypothetical protein